MPSRLYNAGDPAAMYNNSNPQINGGFGLNQAAPQPQQEPVVSIANGVVDVLRQLNFQLGDVRYRLFGEGESTISAAQPVTPTTLLPLVGALGEIQALADSACKQATSVSQRL